MCAGPLSGRQTLCGMALESDVPACIGTNEDCRSDVGT